ncbi:hypothetical protein [Thalassovita taeanensis]|uniref:hypothetical protein n=1 Tax=Thalassovita taeanensis TaxID=657014 RepID=UPI001115016F|nr:hypothetical protein [Thalassovita taeanensis]
MQAATAADALDVLVHAIGPEELQREKFEAQGRFLARQDRWDELGALIRQYDQARAATEGGMPLADLLAYGARADVVTLVEAALTDPGQMSKQAPRQGLAELEEVLAEYPEDYGVALVVIHAYIDIAWAWRGEGWAQDVPPSHWRKFIAKMKRASDLLDGFNSFECNSPALAAAQCALLSVQEVPQVRVADDYEDLIELDPTNPRHMRAFGNHLLPRWFGSYQQLEVEARRIAVLTGDVWDAGGYVWMYLDALAADPQALDMLDTDFFVEGLRDILTRRTDQHTVNMLAAFCSVTLSQPRFRQAQYRTKLAQITAAFDWILQDHLREIHPLLWGMAADGPEPRLSQARREVVAEAGRGSALQRIAEHFEAEIRKGARIVFAESGPQVILTA